MRSLFRVVVFGLFLYLIVGGFVDKAKAEAEKIRIFNAKTGEIEEVEKIIKSDNEWKKKTHPRAT